jgi:hypothetical protein
MPPDKHRVIRDKDAEKYFELKAALLEFARLFDYEEPNDRAIVIVGATFLETLLEHLLYAFLIDDKKKTEKLFGYGGPLGTFSGKIKMAYCLGLIYKPVRDDLNCVRKIRNEFAHNLYASFENRRIAQWAQALQWHRISYVSSPPDTASSRDLYQVGVHQLVTYLDGAVGIARDEKRQVPQYT